MALPQGPKVSCYLYTGAGSATGGGAFPLPLPTQPQPLRLATENKAAIVTIRSLLIKKSSP